MASVSDVQTDMMVDDEDDSDDEDGSGFEGVGWSEGTGAPKPEEMADSMIPDADDWPAKTMLAPNDPHRLAAVEQWGRIFPETADYHEEMLQEYTQSFLKSKTSVGGAARTQIFNVLQAMFGSGPSDNKGVTMVGMLGGDDDN